MPKYQPCSRWGERQSWRNGGEGTAQRDRPRCISQYGPSGETGATPRYNDVPGWIGADSLICAAVRQKLRENLAVVCCHLIFERCSLIAEHGRVSHGTVIRR